jgi:LPPG:FO 2-phospho-L-lactate transferase
MRTIVALCGGVGGAKLALGLDRLPVDLRIIVNTGDDFLHYGLPICPDFDTLAYTLAGLANVEQGWGRAAETLAVQAELAGLGETTWFTLGDKDIALHLLRARLLAEGARLAPALDDIRRRLGIRCAIWPMSDHASPTLVDTEEGVLAFQEYFVGRRCTPVVRRVRYGAGVGCPEALAAMTSDRLDGVVICPSNPVLSIAPILAVPELHHALAGRRAPALAVSPLIAGRAVKGPTAKIFAELGLEVSALSVARYYEGLIDGFMLDEADASLAPAVQALGITPFVAATLMHTDEDRVALAECCVDALRALRS